MSKSIASQVRSMAKKKEEERIAECADLILDKMSKEFGFYILTHDFPSIYRAEVTIVLLEQEWYNFTYNEIQSACASLNLLHKTSGYRHFIKMIPFDPSLGLEISTPQMLYKKIRSQMLNERKERKGKSQSELSAEIESRKTRRDMKLLQAQVQAENYLAEVLNQLKSNNFSVKQVSAFTYHINVPLLHFKEWKFNSILERSQLLKTFTKHRFTLIDYDNSHCEFEVSTD